MELAPGITGEGAIEADLLVGGQGQRDDQVVIGGLIDGCHVHYLPSMDGGCGPGRATIGGLGQLLGMDTAVVLAIGDPNGVAVHNDASGSLAMGIIARHIGRCAPGLAIVGGFGEVDVPALALPLVVAVGGEGDVELACIPLGKNGVGILLGAGCNLDRCTPGIAVGGTHEPDVAGGIAGGGLLVGHGQLAL